MGLLAIATDYRVGKYKGGKKEIAISTAKGGGNDYTAMHCFAPGLEVNPADSENLVIDRMRGSSSFMTAIGGTNQEIQPETAKGERRIFSTSEDGKTIKSDMIWKNDGTILIKIGTTEIEFSATGLKVTIAGLSYDFVPHTHPTPAGPSGPTNPA